MTEPNDSQQALIDGHDGTYLVDAGPGTGKTFTLTRRYAALVETGTDPQDILLTTFTRNAAETMRDRIIGLIDDRHDLAVADAPISTFHAHCQGILEDHGSAAASHLGIEATIPQSLQVMGSELLERQEFERFLRGFRQDHPEHSDFYGITDAGELLGLIHTLAARGIAPTADGWYREGRRLLEGDTDRLQELAEQANRPTPEGNMSDLALDRRAVFQGRRFEPGAPTYNSGELLVETEDEDEKGNRIRPALIEAAIEDDREELFAFIHDLYHAYIEHCLRRNYISFGLVLLLAYVLLREDDAVRHQLSFEHVMIDEFQDTNPLQFRIALLLSATDNICAVGDWKQSIYSFQHADVDNILEFGDRLRQYHADMDAELDWEPGEITTLRLQRNYRSRQDIIDRSERCFSAPATQDERRDGVDPPEITALEADRDGAAEIAGYVADDQHAAVADILIEQLEDGTAPSDITVLSRTTSFARELFGELDQAGLPVAYAGGVELFRTDPGVLVLNWLRLVADQDPERGLVTVLDAAGYRMHEKAELVDEGVPEGLPDEMQSFLERLRGLETVSAMARAVLDRYGHEDAVAAAIVDVLADHTSHGWMTVGRAVSFIEDCIEENEEFDVDTDRHGDAITVQTIHSAKGLEYDTVVLADCTRDRFPSRDRDRSTLRFQAVMGLRSMQTVGDHPEPYDSWQSRLVHRLVSGNADEERRLLYVALTRARDRCILVGEADRPSPFLEHLTEPQQREIDRTEYSAEGSEGGPRIGIEPVHDRGPITLDPHRIMEIEGTGSGGMAAGERLHCQAERFVRDGTVPDDPAPGFGIVREHLGQDGEAELECSLSLDGEPPIVFSGVIDYLEVGPDRVRIVDLKTDADARNLDQYRIQLSVYARAMAAAYPDRDVSAQVLYTSLDRCETITPLTEDRLRELVMEEIDG